MLGLLTVQLFESISDSVVPSSYKKMIKRITLQARRLNIASKKACFLFLAKGTYLFQAGKSTPPSPSFPLDMRLQIDCISESRKMVFNQFILLRHHFVLFKSKINKKQNFCSANNWNNWRRMKHIQSVCRLPTQNNGCSRGKNSCLTIKMNTEKSAEKNYSK